MAQWISIEEAAVKYRFEAEYLWVLIEMREIIVDYQRPDVDFIDDRSIQDFVERNRLGATQMYIDKLERLCIDKSRLCSIYTSLLGKQDKEITILQAKWLRQCARMRKLEKELALAQTACRACWFKRFCMRIRK